MKEKITVAILFWLLLISLGYNIVFMVQKSEYNNLSVQLTEMQQSQELQISELPMIMDCTK